MRNNYEIAAIAARQLFLKWNTDRMAERCSLETDANMLRIRFLDRYYRIEKSTGIVTREYDGSIAEFSEVMSIYDLLCRDTPLPREKHIWKAAHALSYSGTASPSEGSLSAKTANYLQKHLDVLDRALTELGGEAFPVGDHACVFPVFDCMNAVFQFWEGDEEFEPNIRFLWDETAPSRLKFETLWYVMGCFENRLIEKIGMLEA